MRSSDITHPNISQEDSMLYICYNVGVKAYAYFSLIKNIQILVFR